MFQIDTKTKTINITRGDVASFKISAYDNRKKYVFKSGDIVRFKVLKCQDCNCVLLSKDVEATAGQTEVSIDLLSTDTQIGDIKSKMEKYWYEVELNPDTAPQTIIGYDTAGAKLFNLYPEGSEVEE